ncbi:hypothetical protein ScPMuIL_011640 [Solemya velum]
MSEAVKWTAIVLTCSNEEWTHVLQKELEIRQQKGYIDRDVILLTVEDPCMSVGSGGATINALLTLTEYISARKGYTVINHDILANSHILILHCGRQYAYDSCGCAFMTLPVEYTKVEYDDLLTSIDLLIQTMTRKIAVKSGPGLWICSTEMLLVIPDDADIPWEPCEACAVTVPCSPEYCQDHGVYQCSLSAGFCENILYQDHRETEHVKTSGTVPVVGYLVVLFITLGEKLLSFYTKTPPRACTYIGLSLFFDVMLPMAPDVIEDDFVSGKYSHYNRTMTGSQSKTLRKARSLLWKELHGKKIKTCMIEGGQYHYLPNLASNHGDVLLDCPLQSVTHDLALTWKPLVHSWIENSCHIGSSTCMMNSILEGSVSVGSRTVVCHSHLASTLTIGQECYIAGIQVTDITTEKPLKIADSMVVQRFEVGLKNLGMTRGVLTTHGRFDNIMTPSWKDTSTVCNAPWNVMLKRTGIKREDLWGMEVGKDDQTLLTARLFPVFHATEIVGLKEILWLQGGLSDLDGRILKRWQSAWRLSLKEILLLVDVEKEFQWRRQQFYKVSKREIADVICEAKQKGFRSIYNSAHIDGFSENLLNKLDEVAKASIGKPGVAARVLANIADVLGCMSGKKGGLRSGPAANDQWRKGFHLIESGEVGLGVSALAKERVQWMSRPNLLVRSARHYEGAAQILIRQAVMTAKEFFKVEDKDLPAMGKWIMAECPVRIDVAGGWSDTPPITYEHGGAVVTVALMINGKKPVGAKVRRTEELKLTLTICGNNNDDMLVECHSLACLEDYCQPHAPGALLKAAFICADIVDMTLEKSLREQLRDRYGGGFEIKSWSNLPHGSGMGTSSILAGAIMAALLRAAGKMCDVTSLIHMVLYLEQLLTTGGGWQDQVGGLCGGIQLGLSEAKLPLEVGTVDLDVPSEVITEFNNRLVLIYTGKTRLARNLLQEVVRNWYARNPEIVETEDNLVGLAKECSSAFKNGELQQIGNCMDRYWQMKKKMAPGCETSAITSLMVALRPFVYGICMAGAGGGGFLYALARDSQCKTRIGEMLQTFQDAEGSVMYEACVDTEGLKIHMDT